MRFSVGGEQKDKCSELIYRFDALDDLLCACRMLRDGGFSVSSSAYAERENGVGACYLIAEPTGDGETRAVCVLSEYGEPCGDRYSRWRIAEHFSPLCKGNAIGILGNL